MKPGYKQTEVGVIPEGWEVASLGKFASFRTGPFGSALHQSDYVVGGVPVVNPMHIDKGIIVPSEGMTISERIADELSEFKLKTGDIIIGRRGEMGRCAVVNVDQSGWLCGTGSMIVRPVGASADYLQRILSSREVVAVIESASVGTTMVNLNQGTLANLKIKFPPLPEQKSIANALSDVDALLAGLDKLIAKKRDIKQATMQQLLTGKTRLPGFTCPWEVRRLGEMASIRNNKILPQDVKPDTLCVELEHVEQGTGKILVHGRAEGSSAAKYRFMAGDVLFGRLRSYLRKYWLAGSDGICSTEIWPIVANEDFLIPEFLFYSVQMDSFINAASVSYGTHMPRADWSVILNYEMGLPSVSEQVEIAAVLSDMDRELQGLRARRENTHLLKQGMMQELLTGRTRLV